MKIMASGPITSWEIDGETMETVTDYIFGLQNVTAAKKLKDTCSLEEKLWETYMQVRKQQLELDMKQQTPKSLQMVTAAMKLEDAYSLEEKLWPT